MHQETVAFASTYALNAHSSPKTLTSRAIQKRKFVAPITLYPFIPCYLVINRDGPFGRAVKCCSTEESKQHGSEETEKDKAPRFKFDPNSEKDAFGRDPKKETEFWMDAAKTVLESDEVQKAVSDHNEKGGDGYTDEQRAYMEFVKSLDQGAENKE